MLLRAKESEYFRNTYIYRNRTQLNGWIYYFTSIKANRTYKFSVEKEIIYFVDNDDKLTTHLFVFRHHFPKFTLHRSKPSLRKHILLSTTLYKRTEFIFGKWKNIWALCLCIHIYFCWKHHSCVCAEFQNLRIFFSLGPDRQTSTSLCLRFWLFNGSRNSEIFKL